MKKYIKINKNDNVAIVLEPMKKGEIITDGDEDTILAEDIDKGHKTALTDIKEGGNIIKYGMPIGKAVKDIAAGEWIHTHNVKTNLSDLNNYEYNPKFQEHSIKIPEKKINVYRRKNGEIGVRNELWIVPTVGCVNGIAKIAINEFLKENDISMIDGINILSHNYGCSQLGDDHENTKIILQDAVKHPNAGGVLVMGLGCENNQIDVFMDTLGDYDRERVRFLAVQQVSDEIEEAKKLLKELFDIMKNDKREETSIAELKVGLECGGSDGFSGITANPMLGEFSDYMANYGGTTLLTEVPEMFGAETLLMERCENREIFEKTVNLINDFKDYFIKHDQVIYENPSPGNKKGGITTLEDKSLGCTQKSGTAKIRDVLKYGEKIKKNGLNLLSAPGNDLVATTALAAAGCHMVFFTTGRGTPYGGFVPTVKISTNTELAENKPKWIDFDAGKLISRNMEMEKLLEEFIDYIVKVANGEKTRNEINEFKELAIFKSGVTL